MGLAAGDTGRRIAFGPFALDGSNGPLWRGPSAVPLRRKAARVLYALAARPGEVVETEALLAEVWRDLAVTPQTLTNVVREIRVALGDTARQPRWVRTLHGRGYVFVGTAAPAADGGEALCVAREAELARLAALWRQAAAGRSTVAFVSGEPGVGKTTLVATGVAALRRHAGPAPPRYAVGACVEQHGGGEAYLPLLEALDAYLAAGDDDAAALVRGCAPSWLAQLPWRLADGEHAALPPASAPRMVREGLTLLRRLADRQPLVLVLEDLHWSDAPTVELLAALARRPMPVPLLVLGTLREVDAARRRHPLVPLVDELTRGGAAAIIRLAPFDRPAVAAYLAARFATGAVPARVAARLEARTAGNPLFLRSAVDALLAARAIAGDEGGGWRIDEGALNGRAALQPLRGFVAAELERLSPAARAVLAAASVAGVPATPAELAGALRRPELAVERLCEELARGGRLLRVAPGRGAIRRYAFVHHAYLQVVRGGLGTAQRRQLSRRLGMCLAALYPRRHDALAARLALLAVRGNAPRQALHWYERAATRAEQCFAYRECAAHLRAALAQLRRLRAPDRVLAGQLHLRLAAAQALVEGYSVADIAAALESSRAHFAAARGGAGRVGHFLAEMGLTRLAITRAEYGAARAHAGRLRRLVSGAPPGFAAPAAYWSSCIAALCGDLRQAERRLDEAAAIGDPPPALRHTDLARQIGTHRAMLLTARGDVEEAARVAAATLARSQALNWPADLAHAWVAEAERLALLGGSAAEAAAAQAVQRAEEYGLPSFLALARCYAAACDPSGTAALRQALAARRRLGDRWQESLLLVRLAEQELAAGDPTAARRTLAAVASFIDATGEAYTAPEVLRLRAACRLAAGGRGAPAAAAGLLRQAVRLARGRGTELFARRAEHALAALM